MNVKIQLQIDELKDGSLIAMLNQTKLGDISNIDVEEKLNTLHNLISAKKYLQQSENLADMRQQLNEMLNESIRNILAELLAYYYVDF